MRESLGITACGQLCVELGESGVPPRAFVTPRLAFALQLGLLLCQLAYPRLEQVQGHPAPPRVEERRRKRRPARVERLERLVALVRELAHLSEQADLLLFLAHALVGAVVLAIARHSRRRCLERRGSVKHLLSEQLVDRPEARA